MFLHFLEQRFGLRIPGHSFPFLIQGCCCMLQILHVKRKCILPEELTEEECFEDAETELLGHIQW